MHRCAAPLVKHVKTLHATKAALLVRAKVRKDWVAAVKLHAAKKGKVRERDRGLGRKSGGVARLR